MYNKSTTKQSKAIWALSIVLVALVAFTSVITFAYFTGKITEQSSEAISFGTLSLNFDGTFQAKDGADCTAHELVPGCTFTLDGKIQATANVASYVKVTFGTTVEGADTTNYDLAGAIVSSIESQMNTKDFIMGSDKSFYILVDKGDGTTAKDVLDLSGLTFTIDAGKVGNEYQGKSIKFTLNAEAIQADHVAINGEVTAENVATLVGAEAWTTVATDGYKA